MNNAKTARAVHVRRALHYLSATLCISNNYQHRALRLKEAYEAASPKNIQTPGAISYEIRDFIEVCLRIPSLYPITRSFARCGLSAIDTLIHDHVDDLGIQWQHEDSEPEEDR